MILYEATTCLVATKRVSLSFSWTNTGTSGGWSRTDSLTGVCLYNLCRTITTHNVELECWTNNKKKIPHIASISTVASVLWMLGSMRARLDWAKLSTNWEKKLDPAVSTLQRSRRVWSPKLFQPQFDLCYSWKFFHVKAGPLFGICERWSAFTNRPCESLQTCCCRHCCRCTGAATRTVFTDRSSHQVVIIHWDF